MRRADRLISITHFLRSRKRLVTAQQIADEFQISLHTVYRDIADLIYTGAPIRGEAGLGYVIDHDYYLPPITFNIKELEAIGLGLSMAQMWSHNVFASEAQTALGKIKAALPHDLQGTLNTLTIRAMPNMGQIPWNVSFDDLRDAIRTRQKIEFTYTKPGDLDPDLVRPDLNPDADIRFATRRRVWPLSLFFDGRVWLLATWCELRHAFRAFRIDRMSGLKTTDERFPDDPSKNLACFLAQDAKC